MSKAEREVKKPVTMESYAWIQTAEGSIQVVDREVAKVCPKILHEMKSGVGSSKNNPITLPEEIKPTTLSLVIDYCRFHLGRHSYEAHKSFDETFLQRDVTSLSELLKLSNYLQLGQLFGSTKKALAEKIGNKSTEELGRMLNIKITEDLSETMESYAWIQTAEGSIQVVEREVAITCPKILHEMKSGVGSSKNNPITLPEKVKPTTLSLVIDYCRFHLGRHSYEAHKSFDETFLQRDVISLLELLILSNYLQLGQLFGSTKKALAEKIGNKSTEELGRMLNIKITEDLSEVEKLKSRECPNHETQMRLLKKLYSNRRKSSVKNVEELKDFLTGVNPKPDKDTREVNDLVSFINGDGDIKGVETTKEKNKNNQEELKKTFSSRAASTKASTSEKVIEKKDEAINAMDSANSTGSGSETVYLLGTQDEICNVNEDTFYDNWDPVKEAETTRDDDVSG
ncbi:hypothetical protein AgCh_037764 [Apium graveolens]